jgi:polyisoprenoid-binding protein YceI
MTSPRRTPAVLRSPLRIVAALLIVAVLAGAAYGGWYLFLRPAAPAAVGSSQAAVPSSSSTPTATGSDAGASPQAGADIAGTWQVDPSIGSFSDFTGSFVGYRVQEELAGIGGQTAVGRTPDVTGSITIEGTTVTAASISADLATLVSDDDRRDGQLRRQALETEQFPTATFVLTSPIELPDGAADGETVQVTGSGDLTLHGQTRAVSVPLEARLDGDIIVLTGSIDIVFADYGMEKPSSFLVLSVDDHGLMELQLFLTRG